MEAINEVNELLTTKLCSPVIIYGVVSVISLICIYLCRRSLDRYNTQKMDNLKNMCTMQELKYLLILGAIMYGLCQYNKTELAWIFLIFPVIYAIIQNSLLYIYVSSAVQNAPQEQLPTQGSHYGLGMNAPLLDGQGPSNPVPTQQTQQTQQTQPSLAKPSNNTGSLLTGSGGSGGSGLMGSMGSMVDSQGPPGWNF